MLCREPGERWNAFGGTDKPGMSVQWLIATDLQGALQE
jgi:hypothetical protein